MITKHDFILHGSCFYEKYIALFRKKNSADFRLITQCPQSTVQCPSWSEHQQELGDITSIYFNINPEQNVL